MKYDAHLRIPNIYNSIFAFYHLHHIDRITGANFMHQHQLKYYGH